jgi:hypothetical protein
MWGWEKVSELGRKTWNGSEERMQDGQSEILTVP